MTRRTNAVSVIIAIALAVLGFFAVEYGYIDLPSAETVQNPDGNVTVYFIDVGQGDAILVESAAGEYVLIDAGDTAYGDDVVAFLEAHGVGTLAAFILTHPHADHIGGADDVLEAVDVQAVYHPGLEKTTQVYADFTTAATAEGCPVYTDVALDPGDVLSIALANITFELLSLDMHSGDTNNAGIVLRMSYGNVDIMLTGDIDDDVEDDLVHAGHTLESEILKVTHHGSRYGSSDEFLDVLDAEVCVISVGDGNRYDHPHDEALDRLEAHGIDIYRTDISGTVAIETDGVGWSVLTER